MSEQLIPVPGTFGENGNFLIERELGRGGMGGVYMGRDKMLDRPVAVKVMLRELGADPAFVEKFKKEAQAAARLIHPNIAQVYSYGISDGMPYMVMELAAGGSLDRLMANTPGATDVTRVFKVIQQVAKALQCAADQGLVHGDVKPENVLFDANGNAKLVDFGLAAMQSDTSEIWGTPYYIAPEKVRKEPVDFRADIYSLGGTLYHALTGVAPFEADDANAVVRARFESDPKRPSEIRPELSRRVDELVLKMLARETKDRFATFEQLISAMDKVMSDGLFASSGAADSSKGGGRKVKLTVRRPHVAKTSAPSPAMKPVSVRDLAADDGEKRDSVGLKVVLVVGGIIGGLALIGGGLAWYVHANAVAEERARQAQIDRALAAGRESVAASRKAVEEWIKTYDKLSVDLMKSLETQTQRMVDVFKKEGKDYSSQLRPPVTKDLVAALATTNGGAQVKAAIERVRQAVRLAAAPAGGTNAVASAKASAAAKAPAKPTGPKFRDPTDEEKDPNSPEGKDYLEEKAKWEAQQAKKAEEAKAKQAAEKAKPQPEKAKTAEELRVDVSDMLPEITKEIVALWTRAYGCEACYIRIWHEVEAIYRLCDEADKLTGNSQKDADRVAEITREAKLKYDALAKGEDCKELEKGARAIRDRAETQVKSAIRVIGQKRLELEHKLRRIKEANDEAVRKAEEAKRRAELVKKETKEAADKFEAICANGNFRQLNFTGAERTLKALKDSFQTPEGALAADLQLFKVGGMRLMHETIVANMKGFTFQTGGKQFFHTTVTEVTKDEIRLVAQNGKTKSKVLWQKFYEQNTANLNELINRYVVNGKRNGVNLSLKDWCQATMGAALMMRIVCPTAIGAKKRSIELAILAVKKFPSYREKAVAIFPDIKFDEAPADDE